MKFFFDNCLSPNLVQAIRLLDDAYEIKHLREKFPGDAKDVDWIGTLASEGDWVIISGDPRITRNPQNRAAWKQSGLTAFFFKKVWAQQGLWDQFWRTVRWWPTLKQTAKAAKPGTGYLVPVNFGPLEPLPQD